MVEVLAMIEREMAGMPKIHEMTPVQARQMFEDAAPFWNEGGPRFPGRPSRFPDPMARSRPPLQSRRARWLALPDLHSWRRLGHRQQPDV